MFIGELSHECEWTERFRSTSGQGSDNPLTRAFAGSKPLPYRFSRTCLTFGEVVSFRNVVGQPKYKLYQRGNKFNRWLRKYWRSGRKCITASLLEDASSEDYRETRQAIYVSSVRLTKFAYEGWQCTSCRYHQCSASQWMFVEFSKCSPVNFPMNVSELNVCSTRSPIQILYNRIWLDNEYSYVISNRASICAQLSWCTLHSPKTCRYPCTYVKSRELLK